jgi:hypothetical protein
MAADSNTKGDRAPATRMQQEGYWGFIEDSSSQGAARTHVVGMNRPAVEELG